MLLAWGSRREGGPLHPHPRHIRPSSSLNIQTPYSGLRGWGFRMVSLIAGEQEP